MFDFLEVPGWSVVQLVPFIVDCDSGIRNCHRTFYGDGLVNQAVLEFRHISFGRLSGPYLVHVLLWFFLGPCAFADVHDFRFPECLNIGMASGFPKHSSLDIHGID